MTATIPAPTYQNMDRQQVSRALVPVSGQESYVRQRFWAKVRGTIGRVPFVGRAISGYYAATDANTPTHVKTVLFAALAYFILPLDLIPDFFAGLGFTDDAAVLLTGLRALSPYITDEHREKAADYLNRS